MRKMITCTRKIGRRTAYEKFSRLMLHWALGDWWAAVTLPWF